MDKNKPGDQRRVIRTNDREVSWKAGKKHDSDNRSRKDRENRRFKNDNEKPKKTVGQVKKSITRPASSAIRELRHAAGRYSGGIEGVTAAKGEG